VNFALELRGIRKRFIAGAGACRASVDALRGVDLIVRGGESVAVCGASGAGKSTLLLIAAGLMSADSGECRWFGEPQRLFAARRTIYHTTPLDLTRSGAHGESHVHLVDLHDRSHVVALPDDWVEKRCGVGDAVMVAVDTVEQARRVSTRVMLLQFGRLHVIPPVQARVAEFVDRSFQRV